MMNQWLNQPHEVSLETLALCNAHCSFCPYPTLERKGTRMSDELIDRLVREMATWEHGFTFTPFKVSEPLLDKRTLPLCERVNREIPHAALRIFTNGSPLTPRNVEAIAGLKNVIHLWVSLNSHDPVEYERLMGLEFERTAENLDYLHGYDFPHPVVLSTVGWPNNPFKRYCAERWPKFTPFVMKRDAWIDYTTPDMPHVPAAPCIRWWELSIMADGKVSLCCMDGAGKYAIGDVNTHTMLEIYNAPLLRARREKMMSRTNVPYPCNGCSY